LNLSRASVYRQRAALIRPPAAPRRRPSPPRSLAVAERQAVLDLLRAPRFADQAPAEVYASLLDEGSYAGKLVTGLGKGGGVSVTVRADHASIEGLIRHGRE
jgi:transposase